MPQSPAPKRLASVVACVTPRLEAYLADLRVLTAIDSGSYDAGGVNQVNDWLEARLGALGFGVQRHANAALGDHLVARRQGDGTARILLLGHADTVYPPGTAAGRPLNIDSDRVRGPGVCDMKGGLLTGIYALEALHVLGENAFGEVVFLTVADEEIDERTSIPLIRALGAEADVAFTLEAARADGSIVTARKTLRWATVEAFGRAAHAGVEPQMGSNAIVALARLVEKLDALNELVPGATVNVGIIAGGTVTNVVPEHARLRLDLRTWTHTDMQTLLDALAQTVDAQDVPGVRFVFSEDRFSAMPGLERTPAVAELEALAIAIGSDLGFALRGAATGGVSDANLVAAAGTPVLDGLGPVGGLDHSPDEYIEYGSIVPRTALLAGLIMAAGS